MKKNRDPVRMCTVCRQLKPRSELFRLVVTGSGAVYDASGCQDGRGLYVCRHESCIARLGKQKRRSREPRASVSPDLVVQLLAEVRSGE